ncbi:hypothetical protein PIROE2DRAFT_9905 [Piromyces sp. E2]|nr:hypothetical protein PIROE2DRAFT_9905 [Piromyces sp. E2]|eukprot:OUM63490.1 hypothetical protein PIROE2DRAFT_9905 [Piromyces sp. E2]
MDNNNDKRNYEPFKNSHGEIDITINECSNSSYINQDIEKSGYLPKCSISCNEGSCVNMNVCNCNGTHFKGLYCNEYYKEEKSELKLQFLDINVSWNNF